MFYAALDVSLRSVAGGRIGAIPHTCDQLLGLMIIQ